MMLTRIRLLTLGSLFSLVVSAVIATAMVGSHGLGTAEAADKAPDSLKGPATPPVPAGKVRVTLHIYSGLPDPSWELTPEQATALVERMGKVPKSFLAPPPRPVYHLGYSGFTIEEIGQSGLSTKEMTLFPSPALVGKETSLTGEAHGDLEQWLLTTASHALPPETRKFAQDSMFAGREQLRQKAAQPEEPPDLIPKAEAVEIEITPRRADWESEEDPPVSRLIPKGRYLLSFPTYNPGNWNAPKVVKKNNCYNYATNRRTNTFAQPGRFCGQTYRQPTTKAGLMRAAICDGLIPVNIRLRARGQEFPGASKAPTLIPKAESAVYGHLVALVLNPGGDYHWYRLDATGFWSHKPGKLPARGLDERGKVIRDPATCSRPNYPQFCGYFLVPSQAVVKGEPMEEGDPVQQTQP